MIARFLTSAAAVAISLAAPAIAQTVAITGGTVWVDEDTGTIENGTVIIVDGVITTVADGEVSPPDGATLIDATGKWVTPGIIAPFSQVGLVEIGAEDSTNDTAAGEETAFSAALNAADGFNPSATAIPVVRLDGITRMAVAPSPGQEIFAGQGLVATTTGDPDSLVEEKAFAYIALGEPGAGRAGGSRSAAWAELTAAIDDARAFPGRYITNTQGSILNRVDARALKAVTNGDQLLLIAAHRASDLRRIISFVYDNPALDVAIVGADEGWLVADELADADIPVIITPFSNLPETFSQLGSTLENASRLIDAGVLTAFANLGNDTHQVHLALQAAGNAVANGVSFDAAMAALTSAPAEIFGMDGVGTLSAGSAADIVIWDGDPLEITSSPDMVFIDGIEQEMESRQTRLRDRYLSLDGEAEAPFRYRRGE